MILVVEQFRSYTKFGLKHFKIIENDLATYVPILDQESHAYFVI